MEPTNSLQDLILKKVDEEFSFLTDWGFLEGVSSSKALVVKKIYSSELLSWHVGYDLRTKNAFLFFEVLEQLPWKLEPRIDYLKFAIENLHYRGPFVNASKNADELSQITEELRFFKAILLKNAQVCLTDDGKKIVRALSQN